MMKCLEALCDRAREAAENGKLTDAENVLTEKVNYYIDVCLPYIEDSGMKDFPLTVRARYLCDTIARTESIDVSDPVDAGIMCETVLYLLGQEAIPLEEVRLKPVLFGADSGQCPYYKKSDMEVPETFNFVLCYAGDTWINQTMYENGIVYLEGSVLDTKYDINKRRERFGLNRKDEGK